MTGGGVQNAGFLQHLKMGFYGIFMGFNGDFMVISIDFNGEFIAIYRFESSLKMVDTIG